MKQLATFYIVGLFDFIYKLSRNFNKFIISRC